MKIRKIAIALLFVLTLGGCASSAQLSFSKKEVTVGLVYFGFGALYVDVDDLSGMAGAKKETQEEVTDDAE